MPPRLPDIQCEAQHIVTVKHTSLTMRSDAAEEISVLYAATFISQADRRSQDCITASMEHSTRPNPSHRLFYSNLLVLAGGTVADPESMN